MKKGKEKSLQPQANWKGFFHLLGRIDLPWPIIILSFLFETGYSKLLLMLPTTSVNLMSGSLAPSDLRDAVIYYALYGIVTAADFWLLGVAGNWAVRNARNKIWGGMTRIQMDYYDAHPAGELTSAVTNDLEKAVKNLVLLITSLLPTLYYIISAMKTIGDYDILLTLSVLVLLPVKYVYMVVVSRWIYNSQVGIFHRIGQLTGYLAERIRNLPLIKYYTSENAESENGTIAAQDLFDANMKNVKVNCANTGLGAVVSALQTIVTVLFGVILLQQGRIDTAQWVAFFLFANTINARVEEIIAKWQSLKSIQGAIARAVDIMEAPQEQSEKDAIAASGAVPVPKGAPSVEFRDVSFSYGEKQALRHVSFTASAGTATAIVGLCGSGKTTLLNLLERFYETEEGKVLLDGGSVREANLTDLRSRFSYVQQDAGVFSGTVREALSYGIRRPLSDSDLTEAARNAGAWDFIQKLPGGLDASITADGQSLSGGQRQRLALAREFLRNADVLLLDEPTSALDATTAQAVEETIFRLFRGKTILMITHDMSLLEHMDQVVVLKEGQLVGEGTYSDLLDTCPLFRDMVQLQRVEVEPA